MAGGAFPQGSALRILDPSSPLSLGPARVSSKPAQATMVVILHKHSKQVDLCFPLPVDSPSQLNTKYPRRFRSLFLFCFFLFFVFFLSF